MGRKKTTKSEILKTVDESLRALELQEEFGLELSKTLRQLINIYPRHSRVKKSETLTEDVFKMVVYSVLISTLREMQWDSSRLTIRDFHRKYVPNLPILYRYDFSSEEFCQIIQDSYLSDRDKKIAYKFFVEKKNCNEVHADLEYSGDVGDKKTVDNNLDQINDAILFRACSYNVNNRN